jgi:uncharacterized protein
MGLQFISEPKMRNPVMFASWPGIGNIGLVATDTLRVQLAAEKFGEIEPWDFFFPKRITIRNSILETMEFPTSNFYHKKTGQQDLITFIGEEQPTDGNRPFAEGRKAYQLANLVVDAAVKFGCRRLYTSGAAVSLSHHAIKPRVWIATSSLALNREMISYSNTVLMGKSEGRGEGGAITGLNGLILGVAKQRGLEAVCMMGEIPDYLSTAPLPYPKASRSVVELMGKILNYQFDFGPLDEMANQVNDIISGIYDKLPTDIRDRVEQRKAIMQKRIETISEEEEKWMKDHIDDLFRQGDKPNDRAG